MEYDFTTVSPEDFERLVCDLLSAEWKAQLEIFKPGPDGGVDLRHSRVKASDPTVIVQCKRYSGSRFAELRRSVESELPKLDRIRPKRYILAASTRLSTHNKEQLTQLLAPYAWGPGDIYGASEVNALLRRYPEVERAHFKLWVSTTAMLERVLHARIFNISDATIDAVRAQVSRLVVHDGFARAEALLNEHHHCVIAGNPGIGKTTLARMLMCHYLRDGYTPIVVVGNIEDAWSTVSLAAAGKEKYIILYDDFLGTFKFDEVKFAKNEDASLMSFVELVRSSSNLRFILTTREYIIADAKRLHGTFARHADSLAKCTVSMKDYAKANRARVLFNHLYFSDLPERRLNLLVNEKVYKDVVAHEHFNPRIVEAISKHANSASRSDEDFIAFIRQKFDDPSELWAHAFEHEISSTARYVLVLLWTFHGSASDEVIKESLMSFDGSSEHVDIALRFRDALKALDGNFIVTNRYAHAEEPDNSVTMLAFQNPSVEEFVEKFLSREPTWMDMLATRLTHFVQVARLCAFWQAQTKARARASSSSTEFWLRLHQRARFAEGSRAGKLFNYQGSQAFTNSDFLNDVQRTHILLQVMVNAKARDARAEELVRRVTTTEGWSALLKGLPSTGSIAFGMRRLVEWLGTQPSLHETLPLCRSALQTATIELLAQQTAWDTDLECLNVFHLCLDLMDIELPPGSLEALERIARAATGRALLNGKQSTTVEHEIAALMQLTARANLKLAKSVKRLRRHVLTLKKVGDASSTSQASPVVEGDEGPVDLDKMFESLLDR